MGHILLFLENRSGVWTVDKFRGYLYSKLSFWGYDNVHKFSDRYHGGGGTVQTPQSDQGLHCLQFILYFYNAFFCGKISMLTLRIITAYFYGILKFKITVYQ